ncbi:MAG: DUF417 family protein [Acidobacteriota bacterium]
MSAMMTGGVSADRGATLRRAGEIILRYGLVAVLLWIGALKFTAYEAAGIEPLVANSPLFAWAYKAFGLHALSMLIGGAEILLGVAIASSPVAPRVSALGSLAAAVMFLTTLSFLVTTPGVWQPDYGFPFPSALPGQFLLKDVVLLGAALWTAGEAFSRQGSFRSMTLTP